MGQLQWYKGLGDPRGLNTELALNKRGHVFYRNASFKPRYPDLFPI